MTRRHTTQTKLVPDTWSHLPQEVRDLTAPIETEAQYQEAVRLFGAVWDQVGETPDHPLGSFFVLLQGHITACEDHTAPISPAPPERMLAFLMDQRDMTQTKLAEVLAISQANVSRLLNGKSRFTVETVRVLAEYFHVAPAVFVNPWPLDAPHGEAAF